MEYSKIWLNLTFAALSVTFIRGYKAFLVFHADRVINRLPCDQGQLSRFWKVQCDWLSLGKESCSLLSRHLWKGRNTSSPKNACVGGYHKILACLMSHWIWLLTMYWDTLSCESFVIACQNVIVWEIMPNLLRKLKWGTFHFWFCLFWVKVCCGSVFRSSRRYCRTICSIQDWKVHCTWIAWRCGKPKRRDYAPSASRYIVVLKSSSIYF